MRPSNFIYIANFSNGHEFILINSKITIIEIKKTCLAKKFNGFKYFKIDVLA